VAKVNFFLFCMWKEMTILIEKYIYITVLSLCFV